MFEKGKTIQTYTKEDKELFVSAILENMNDKGKPAWHATARWLNANHPGRLRGKKESYQVQYLMLFWKKHNPIGNIPRTKREAVDNLNKNLDRENLIEMLKVKAQEFMLVDYDQLTPQQKVALVKLAIEADAEEEKIELARAKLSANKRMMDNLASSLMSGDHTAILSKYQIEIKPGEEYITIVPNEDKEKPNALATSGEPVITLIG